MVYGDFGLIEFGEWLGVVAVPSMAVAAISCSEMLLSEGRDTVKCLLW